MGKEGRAVRGFSHQKQKKCQHIRVHSVKISIFATQNEKTMHKKLLHLHRHVLVSSLTAMLLVLRCMMSHAQTCVPTATFSYTNADGENIEEEAESYSGSAPMTAIFKANPEDAEGFEARYEWLIYEQGKEEKTLVHRFEENLEYTFAKSGSFYIELKATFTNTGGTMNYPEEGEDGVRFQVSIAESRLEMPNAFSPNGDGYNDTYHAKDTHQSIIEFHATIFNRWGQKLYSWDDINGAWDGKVNGRVIKDGVYFVNVTAKGADGRVYHIRKDINVLTKYTEAGGSTGGGE